jgi:hypothetical protein
MISFKNKFSLLLCLVPLVLSSCFLQSKAKQHQGKQAYFDIISAYPGRHIAGIRGVAPETTMYFKVIWRKPTFSGDIYWRGDGTWAPCKVEKIHMVRADGHNLPAGIDYKVEPFGNAGITSGDTLLFTALKSGTYPLPAEVDKKSKNTLYLKSSDAHWFSFPVRTIEATHNFTHP